MSAMNDMLLWLSKCRVPFYIEHNDFLNADLDIHDEVQDLLNDGYINAYEVNNMLADNCIWSVRLHIKPCYPEIAYGATLHKAIEKLYYKIKDK